MAFIGRPNLPEGLVGLIARLKASTPDPLATLIEQLGGTVAAGITGASERRVAGEAKEEARRKEARTAETAGTESLRAAIAKLALEGGLGGPAPMRPIVSTEEVIPALRALGIGPSAGPMSTAAGALTTDDLAQLMGVTPIGPSRLVTPPPKFKAETAADVALKAARVKSAEAFATKAEKEGAAGAGKMLPAPTVLHLNEGKNVARLLPEVEVALKENEDLFGPLEGRARALNPYDKRAQTVIARMKSASQAFGRFMEGGVLRKEDEIKYEGMFPNLKDEKTVARNKLAIIRRQLNQKYNDDVRTEGRSGYDVSGFDVLEIPPSIFGEQEAKPAATPAIPGEVPRAAAAPGAGGMTPEDRKARIAALKAKSAEGKK